MRKIIYVLLAVAFCQAGVLVTVEEAVQLLNEPETVILFVGKEDAYKGSHIKGAILVPLEAALRSEGDDGLSDEIPDPEVFQSFISSAGITRDSKVLIVYANKRGTYLTGRLLLAFDAYGFPGELYILNGGQTAWDDSNPGMIPARDKVDDEELFTISFASQKIADISWVENHLTDNQIRMVDARPAPMYQGKGISSKGHIPGAVNIEFNEVIDKDEPHMFLGSKELWEVFNSAGLTLAETVVPYCGTGIWAANIYIAARHLGYDTKFYDGSFHEWSDHDMPMEKPVKRGLFR